MKSFCLALIVMVACISCAEGLRCNRCVPSRPGSRCTNTVETCQSDNDVCGRVFFKPPLPISYFKRCMKASDCALLGGVPNVDAFCCSNNLCN